MTLLVTSKASEISKIRIRFLGIPFSLLIILFPLFFINLLTFLVTILRVFVSLSTLDPTSLISSSKAADLSARPLTFLSPFSYSFSLFISSSCSLSFPNKVVVLKVVRSLVSKIVVTFSCQVLSRHFKIFILISSLSKTFLKTN